MQLREKYYLILLTSNGHTYSLEAYPLIFSLIIKLKVQVYKVHI